MPTPDIVDLLAKLSSQDYCYQTTKGRVSGKPHEIEIWFGTQGENIFLLSGGGLESDWVKNLQCDPTVQVRIGKHSFDGTAKLVANPNQDQLARELLATKYYRWEKGKRLNQWARTAVPVVIKLSKKR